jgi:Tfp pilus assembly protein PilO
MKRRIGLLLVLLIAAGWMLLWPQEPDQRLPSGKSQKEEILKADHQKSLRDAAEIVKLAEELKAELEKNDYHVLSVSALKKTETIEKLARNIKGRLRRF